MIRSPVLRKVGFAVALAVAVWTGSGAAGFPRVFQLMFVLYVALGLGVFLLLDAPPMAGVSGWSAVAALVGLYAALSVVYVAGASALPQFDPAVEKGKIEKILKRKRAAALADRRATDELLERAERLRERSSAMMTRLARFAPAGDSGAGALMSAEPVESSGGLTVVEQGAEIYDLYECYNCHKIGGKGSVKKRGPALDNIGGLLTINDIRKKILDPGYLYAAGFEKEHKKGRMPDKYRDLMTEQEVLSLATYLSTLKNPDADTPRPVFVRADVQHGFTVFGHVRDASGTGLADVEVRALPGIPGGHAASGRTDDSGYYELFLHMHNENAGAGVVVSARGVTQEFTADYDPDDRTTKRQQSVDLTVADGTGS